MSIEQNKRDYVGEGAAAYQEWRDGFLSDPDNRRVYDEEAPKVDLWLQLAEARQAAGFTQAELANRLGVSQAQVARMEKRGYDAYTLTSLRRYVDALGDGFTLEVKVNKGERYRLPRPRGAPALTDPRPGEQ
jgi:DNA-binding XRE family transcriptional regulator